MKILITGAAGFIGSEFTRLAVKTGLSVSCVDKLTYSGDLERIKSVREKLEFFQVDLRDKDSLEAVFVSERPEAVVHFAAETHVDRSILEPMEFIHSNIIGTMNLMELSRKYKIKKIIHISTDEVYGDLSSASAEKFAEANPLLPNSPYSASKASADLLVRAHQKTYGLPVLTVRPSNTYGPWQYPEKLLPLTISNAFQDKPIFLYGKGENIRTWLFVEDCAKGIMSLLEKGRTGEIYNIGSADERKNRDIVLKVLELMGKSPELIQYMADRPGHDFRYALETRKVHKETGWKPQVSLDEGLERVVDWSLENKEWLMRKRGEVEEFVRTLKKRFEEMHGGPRN